MYKVLVTGNVRQEGLDIISPFTEMVHLPEPVDQKALAHHLCDADAVLHKMGRLDSEALQGQRRLKIIARHGVGLDLLDMDHIRSINIPVTITLGVNSNAVAELAVAMMIYLIRQMGPARDSLCHHKIWNREAFMGLDLKDQTVGLMGLGGIGKRVTELLSVFGTRLLVHDPYVTEKQSNIELVSLTELFGNSDIISLHCPLSSQTRNLINPTNIDQLKDGFYLINTARGGIIDEDFLVQMVKSGKIAGAALDAFASEPPDYDHELFTLENVLCIPHIGAMSTSAQIGMAIGAAKEIERVLSLKKPPEHLVF